jgi:hypothetical protein
MHLKEINKIIKYLILSDLAFWTGWGLITPIFAIFITEHLAGTALTVGIATAIYWITKAVLQYPFGLFLDRCRGDDDDYFFLVWGTFIASLIPLGYLFATTEWYIYILQFFYGVGMAASIAGWRAIFTRNIDKGHEAADWSLDDAIIGLGSGLFGFIPSFLAASTLGILGVILLLCLRKDILRWKK